MSPPANRWDTCRQDDSQSVHTSPPDDSDDDDAVLRRIAQPARLPELIPEPKNTGGDCVGPARLVQVIQAWENPYDKHEKFLRLKLGETLKLTHPEMVPFQVCLSHTGAARPWSRCRSGGWKGALQIRR
eukprot:g981.t1